MSIFYKIIESLLVTSIVILTFYLVFKIDDKLQISRRIRRLFYVYVANNYEIWIKSKFMSLEECDAFIEGYEHTKELKTNIDKIPNVIRFLKAVQKRKSKLISKSK